MATKVCATCGVEKPLKDFSPSKSGKQGRVAHCRLCKRILDRAYYERNSEDIRVSKRDQMRERRATPEINTHINTRRRTLYPTKSKQGQKLYLTNLREKHFFVWRARLWSARHKERITAQMLWSLWRKQHGRCVLSGRKLGRDAHLDHFIPISKGGSHGIENLRWLDPYVNVARGDATDEEFVAMCRQVVGWKDPNH